MAPLLHRAAINSKPNMSSTCPHNRANFVPLTVETCWRVWVTPANFIHFRGLLSPDRILPGAKFTLRPSLAFSYIGSVTARHSISGSQPNFAAWYKEWNYLTFAEGATYIRQGGHHVGHRPTFSLTYIPHLWPISPISHTQCFYRPPKKLP